MSHRMARRRGIGRPVLGVAREDRSGRGIPLRLRQPVPSLGLLLLGHVLRQARLWHLRDCLGGRTEHYTIFLMMELHQIEHRHSNANTAGILIPLTPSLI